MRDRRVSGASALETSVELNAGTATATASVSYRSPFGAARKASVQFAFELAHDGGSWRIATARIVGSPRFD
jgi:hypothetical protein